MKNYNPLLFIILPFIFSCKDRSKTSTPETNKADSLVYAPADTAFYHLDKLLLNTIRLNRITINGLSLRVDTLAAIKQLGNAYSKDVYARGLCYYFGDANLWDFNGARYYLHKDSLYFHELYFDDNYKKQNFTIKLPNLTVSSGTSKGDFEKAYPASFTNSEQSLSNSILFRTGDPWRCFLRFDYKGNKLWRVAIGM